MFSHTRVIDLWNALPYDVKHARNTVQFKQLYDKNLGEWSGCWFEKNWSYIRSIADPTWRNQDILNIPIWKMENYFTNENEMKWCSWKAHIYFTSNNLITHLLSLFTLHNCCVSCSLGYLNIYFEITSRLTIR